MTGARTAAADLDDADLGPFLPRTRFQPTLAFSPAATELFFSSNSSGQFNVWAASMVGGSLRQFTAFDRECVRSISVAPDGGEILVTADRDGDERHKVYAVAPDGATQAWESEERVQHVVDSGCWSPDGRSIAYAANTREPADMEVWIRDRASGAVRHLFGEGMYAWPVSWSPDGRHLLVQRFLIHTDSSLYLVDVESGEARELTPHEEDANFRAGPWRQDGSGFHFLTNEGREYLGLAFYDVKEGRYEWVETPEFDIDDVAASGNGRFLAWVTNERGWSRLHVRDLVRSEDMQAPALPRGSLERYTTALTLSYDGGWVAVLWSQPTRPTEVYVVDTTTGRARRLTESARRGVAGGKLVVPEEIEYTSFDGRSIPAFLYRPQTMQSAPVVLSIHGGPEFQDRPWYQPLYQYLLSRGIAILAPNYRGSTGYGRTYQRLIHHDWGGAELQDLIQAAEWLRSQSWVDPDRLGVFGISFGGFATLSCIARYPEYWKAAVDIYGSSNLLTSTRAFPETWKRFVAQSIGDPETEADFLLERSPITYVENIRTPLLVVQGAKDPRVLPAESEQIVEGLRARGCEVEYLLFEDEGHGFLQRENELRALRASAAWFERHLVASR
jgi:dipeptidyl aminopeptidase/acylaminoacyl peptidase